MYKMIHISFLKTDSLHPLSKPWCKTAVCEFHECMLHFFKSHVNTWKPYAIPLRTLCHICLSVFSLVCPSICLSLSSWLFLSLYPFVIHLCMLCHICLSVCVSFLRSVHSFVCLSSFLFLFVHLFAIYLGTLCQLFQPVSSCIFSFCPYVCSYKCQSIIISFPIKQFLHYWTLSLSPPLCVCLFKCHQHLMSSLPACW